MSEVTLYFKLVETADYVPGGADGYTVEKGQTVEGLKVELASYYDLGVTASWILTLGYDTGRELDNSKSILECGLKNNDVLFIRMLCLKIWWL